MSADEVVIVTGVGGNLGTAVAELLAARGSQLVLVERTAANLAATMDRLPRRERHLAMPGVELTDAAAAGTVCAEALARFGRIDGLAHTVGSFAMADIDAADPAHWEGLYRANLLTTLSMCRAVAPHMRAAGRGAIVTIGATAAAARAAKGMAAYAAAKSAVLRLTESLADELKSVGVRANCVLPSIIDTPQNRAAMPKADTSRWVRPVQIAEVIAFLLSDAASGVTGAAIPVTGRG